VLSSDTFNAPFGGDGKPARGLWHENRFRFGKARVSHQLADRFEYGRNCSSYVALHLIQPRARSECAAESNASGRKARMISMLTWTARGLRSTPDSMATPCSVKA